MLLTVRHIDNRNIRRAESDKEMIKFAKDELKNNNYIRVADIELDSIDIDYALERAFYLTNSIDTSWYKNTVNGLTVSENAANGCRSTRTGDLVQYKGESYVVCINGFTKI